MNGPRDYKMTDLVVREYGSGLHTVIAVHGGPAAAGDLAPLAQDLGKRFHVLEPFQRGSGLVPLTVASHVRDLHDLIGERCGGRPPVLLGHSWGAMLALAYAAVHLGATAGLVLIGCGAFSDAARREFESRLDARLSPGDRAELLRLRSEADRDRRLAAEGRIMNRVYGYDLRDDVEPVVEVDAVAHRQTWADMLRMQREGTYPAAFAAIKVPVLMLHGEQDPHPGRLTREDLRAYVPQLEYRELPACGHSPWVERQARTPFFDAVNAWLESAFRARTTA